MPLTTDYASAQLFMRSAHPRLATSQGTAISEAIELAMRVYEEQEMHHKAIIIITDGENHDDRALEVMERGRESGLVPYVIGVGTQEGGFIPVTINNREDYKRDQQGNPVRTVLNDAIMQDLASTGGGEYYSIFNAAETLDRLKERIEQIEKLEMEQRSFKEYESYFQYFILLGLLMLLAELLISKKKSLWLRGKSFFN
jgi:Ca-activated chloride channel family protein